MSLRGVIYSGETQELDQGARSSAPGRFVQLSDGMVHYELAGPSGPQTVVLVHGYSVPYPIWDPTFDFLVQSGLPVLRYDLYGRGYSDRPDIRYDQDLMDRQLAEILEALNLQQVDLVGLSMGGAISVVFTARHPERVRKLCLIDPVGLPRKMDLRARLARAPVLGEWIMGYRSGRELVSKLQGIFYGDRGWEALEKVFIEQMKYRGFKRALLSTLRSGIQTGALEAYKQVGRLQHPAMLIWGREDQTAPYELSQTVIESIPRIEFHAIDEAAHIPHYERPVVVNPLILDFLTR